MIGFGESWSKWPFLGQKMDTRTDESKFIGPISATQGPTTRKTVRLNSSLYGWQTSCTKSEN